MKHTPNRSSGMTLAEIALGLGIAAVFFACIFQVNAVCLAYIGSSKEAVAAFQNIHDRVEVLRNVAFPDLVSTDYVQDLLGHPANASDFVNRATEVVTLAAYPAANGVTQFTRSPNGTVTRNSTASDLGDSVVQISVTNSWTTSFGRRARSEQTTTLVSNGSKK
jgi:hypothetical protein